MAPAMNRLSRHILLASTGWVMGTFALHCWLLYALDGFPNYQVARADSMARIAAVNREIAAENAADPEKQAEARAAMSFQDKRLFHALSAQENAEISYLSLAGNANVVVWRVARRAWISWAAVALTPIIFLAWIRLRTGLANNRGFTSRAPAPTNQ